MREVSPLQPQPTLPDSPSLLEEAAASASQTDGDKVAPHGLLQDFKTLLWGLGTEISESRGMAESIP